jgi:serine/threonine protein kinase
LGRDLLSLLLSIANLLSLSPNKDMAKRKASAATTGANRCSKRSKRTTTSQAFIWNPRQWKIKTILKADVSVLENKYDRTRKVVKKVLEVVSNSNHRPLPLEIMAIELIPDCNRIVTPVHYSPSDPDAQHGTAFFEYHHLGDLEKWRQTEFEARNYKPVPESYIWRFLLQMSQALALLQNKIGPNRHEREIILHRDIKPGNILVANNGTTYPSFTLHDFGCASIYRKSTSRRSTVVGTFAYQPPENPIVNTRAAEIWAMGACVHYLATGNAPLESIPDYVNTVFAQNNRHPHSAQQYANLGCYYSARVPRHVTPINLSPVEQQQQNIGPFLRNDKECFNPQYSDTLNKWMKRCLSSFPGRRPTVERLLRDMVPEAKIILKKMGGAAAMVDLEVDFDTDA